MYVCICVCTPCVCCNNYVSGSAMSSQLGRLMVDMLVESEQWVQDIMAFFSIFIKLKDAATSKAFKVYTLYTTYCIYIYTTIHSTVYTLYTTIHSTVYMYTTIHCRCIYVYTCIPVYVYTCVICPVNTVMHSIEICNMFVAGI